MYTHVLNIKKKQNKLHHGVHNHFNNFHKNKTFARANEKDVVGFICL